MSTCLRVSLAVLLGRHINAVRPVLHNGIASSFRDHQHANDDYLHEDLTRAFSHDGDASLIHLKDDDDYGTNEELGSSLIETLYNDDDDYLHDGGTSFMQTTQNDNDDNLHEDPTSTFGNDASASLIQITDADSQRISIDMKYCSQFTRDKDPSETLMQLKECTKKLKAAAAQTMAAHEASTEANEKYVTMFKYIMSLVQRLQATEKLRNAFHMDHARVRKYLLSRAATIKDTLKAFSKRPPSDGTADDADVESSLLEQAEAIQREQIDSNTSSTIPSDFLEIVHAISAAEGHSWELCQKRLLQFGQCKQSSSKRYGEADSLGVDAAEVKAKLVKFSIAPPPVLLNELTGPRKNINEVMTWMKSQEKDCAQINPDAAAETGLEELVADACDCGTNLELPEQWCIPQESFYKLMAELRMPSSS